jgi:spore coat-associated protein N
MFNKKIILSLLIISAAATIAAANTWAFFSDSITSTGNEITTGTLHLTINPDTSFMTIEGVTPGSSGSVDQIITNSGTVPGKLKIDFGGIQESADTEVPSATGTSTLLDSVMANIKLVKASDGSLVKQLVGTDLDTVPIASCSGLSVSNIPIDANTAYDLVIHYEIPSNTDTGIQGKKLTFGVTYTLST